MVRLFLLVCVRVLARLGFGNSTDCAAVSSESGYVCATWSFSEP